MKLFVVSDIHSFFTPFKEELNLKGFDNNNPEHYLVICGDVFDRGDESEELLEYLLSINNLIYVKGNHEYLLEQMIQRGYPHNHDYSNGTVKTVLDLSTNANSAQIMCQEAYHKVKPLLNKYVDYFETKNYIFVHGWIPVNFKLGQDAWNGVGFYNPDWRKASHDDWYSASWLNGMNYAMKGIVEPGKTIVCGHYHTSWGHTIQDKENGIISTPWGKHANFNPFYCEGCIAIDACTAYSGKVNVLVIEDEFLI